MDNFLQQLINGLTLGSIYGLIAIGYTMVFRHHRHGQFRARRRVHAVRLYRIDHIHDFDPDFALGVAAARLYHRAGGGYALTALWNWAIERLAYRPLRGSFRLAPLISAIGMSIFLSNFVQVVQGPRNKPAPQLPNHVFNVTVM